MRIETSEIEKTEIDKIKDLQADSLKRSMILMLLKSWTVQYGYSQPFGVIE